VGCCAEETANAGLNHHVYSTFAYVLAPKFEAGESTTRQLVAQISSHATERLKPDTTRTLSSSVSMSVT